MARCTLFLALASAMIVAAAASPAASRKLLQGPVSVDVAAPLTAVSVNVASLQSSLQSVLPLRSVAPATTTKAASSAKSTTFAPLALGKGKLDLGAIKTEVKAIKAGVKAEVKAIKAEVTGKAKELVALPTKVAASLPKSLPLGKGRKLGEVAPLEALKASLPKLGKGKAVAIPSIETVKAELKGKLESLVPKGKGALPTLKAAPAVPLALPTIKTTPVSLPTLKTTPLALPTLKTTPLALPTLKVAPVQKATTSSVKAAGTSVNVAVQNAAKSVQSAATSVGVQVANLVGVKVNA